MRSSTVPSRSTTSPPSVRTPKLNGRSFVVIDLPLVDRDLQRADGELRVHTVIDDEVRRQRLIDIEARSRRVKTDTDVRGRLWSACGHVPELDQRRVCRLRRRGA